VKLGDEDGEAASRPTSTATSATSPAAPNVCWMVGAGGNVIRSTDAGRTGSRCCPPEVIPATGAGE
jgi:photosystem II stability/assembly factor-like uncharacterized protein